LRIASDGQTDGSAWSATWALSREHNLTLYDAAYLELAIRLQRGLASRDAALRRAARAVGIEIIGD
jgi:predicted nucleic acid-binding protein